MSCTPHGHDWYWDAELKVAVCYTCGRQHTAIELADGISTAMGNVVKAFRKAAAAMRRMAGVLLKQPHTCPFIEYNACPVCRRKLALW